MRVISQLRGQSQMVKELNCWAKYSWYHVGFGHVLLLGSAGSGKTSVAALLAQDLAKAHCCLVTRVDCSSWKGKSAETIEKSLVAEIKSLSKRTPSLLILDDFEFLSQSNGEDQRNLGTERIL
ncbi:hypothetical protein OSTOST_03608, partial [Ostertagia ostertagi]